MRILHVLSQTQLTGAEVYALTLAKFQLSQGNEVFIVSDSLHIPTEAQFIAQPIDNRKYKQRFKNIAFIKDFTKSNQIDVVHAHSRAASWVSYFSLLGTKIPLISTIHGRQHLHFSTSFYDIYGDAIIPICENLKHHLIQEVKIDPKKIRPIPNGFSFSSNAPSLSNGNHFKKNKTLSVIGRTTGPKGERITELLKFVFPTLLQQFPDLIIQIIGGDVSNLTDGQSAIEKLNNEFNNRIQVTGIVNNLPEWMAQSDLIIGSGRVAIESLFMNKPTIAVGEGLYVGKINLSNIEEGIASNFGDITQEKTNFKWDYLTVIKDISEHLSNVTTEHLSGIIQSTYDINKVNEEVNEVYASAIMNKNIKKHIPVLMYHKVPEHPIESKHKIFVTKANFEKHLRFLKSKGFTSITFQDYHLFRTGKKPFTQFPVKPIILTFDDGYLDNFENVLPLTNKYHFKGVMFLLGDAKINYNYWDVKNGEHRDALMDTNQKKAFVESGWEIGGHSLTHADLTKLDASNAMKEISESKSNLETQLNTKVITFAYPFGILNEQVKDLVKQSNYQFAVATDSGGLMIEDDLMQIFRVNIFPDDGVFQLFKKTSAWYRKYYRMKRKK